DQKLLLDLSHTKPTDDGFHYFRSEEGSLGFIPEVVEIGRNKFRYVTYVFQFPLRLDFRVSESDRISAPQGDCELQLRFGYGREPFEVFFNREFKQSYSIEEWQNRIANDWQEHVETDPITVDFSE